MGLVLTVLVSRWRVGAWDIERDEGPPPPSIQSVCALLIGLVLVGAGLYLILRDY